MSGRRRTGRRAAAALGAISAVAVVAVAVRPAHTPLPTDLELPSRIALPAGAPVATRAVATPDLAPRSVPVSAIVLDSLRDSARHTVRTPPAGSPERQAILDAVRREVKTRARFRVHGLLVWGTLAYVRCGEIVPLEGGELQETDLDIAALVERGTSANAPWTVREIWTLPTHEERPWDSFRARVAERVRIAGGPRVLVPDSP